MNTNKSSTNESFCFLSNSGDFLNIILNNINSCILLLNYNMELQAFNDNLKTIFSNKKDEHLLYKKCGEAIGCAYQVEEEKECGNTSQCAFCELRESALESYVNDRVIYKEHFQRPFYTSKGVKTEKHLQFSTRLFHYRKDKYIILIIEDISKYMELKLKEQMN